MVKMQENVKRIAKVKDKLPVFLVPYATFTKGIT
jgi:hypothetical protein